ncbi:(2Fe-2S)-binding protein [Mesorhizobium sp. YR577]|uniref:(2Fe-2S)-binding protein n=1 Tax=Mesorhizobium sp. YR577 TaxID=1884373 RepID=UPI0008DEFD51|nr:(2Fe-2S)-binding protein [Mesorhizobium sp. YR577]SFU23218.1 2Fe-2S iron-sulfur cluster binding domain-containing protein [Mesorhizobium sp. YR577]
MFRSVLETPSTASDMLIVVNGVETPAWQGETVASVLLRVPDAGRISPVSGKERLPYCQMGVCFDCLAIVDGMASTQGCLVPVTPGMRIESQRGPREMA